MGLGVEGLKFGFPGAKFRAQIWPNRLWSEVVSSLKVQGS